MTLAEVFRADRRARTAARAMGRATIVVGLLFGGAMAYIMVKAAVDRAWLDALLAANLVTSNALNAGPAVRLAVLAWTAAQTVSLGIALHAVWQTFNAIASREMLPLSAGAYMRRAGIAFAISAGLMIAAQPMMSLVLSLGAPTGQRFISLSVNFGQLLTLFISGVMIALGHVLTLAGRICDDNRQIV